MTDRTKLIFFDVDNTLWDEHMQIPASTAMAIRQLKEAGHMPFICTGRARGNLRSEELLSLPFSGIVAGCGNYIELDGKVIYENLLSEELLKKSLEIMQKYHMYIVLEGPEDHWIDDVGLEGDPYVDYLYRVLGDAAHSLKGYEEGMKVTKISALIKEETNYEQIVRELGKELTFIRHPGPVVEMVPYGSSKASGIRRLCRYLQIPVGDTYAVGDSTNDLEMLACVGHGIAMGNGTKQVKEIAEYVTGDIHEDGLYHAMDHYGLLCPQK